MKKQEAAKTILNFLGENSDSVAYHKPNSFSKI
jgi:hypothetical protein